MARICLQLVLGTLVCAFHYGSGDRDTLPGDHNSGPDHGRPNPPFIDQLPEEISLLNKGPSLTNERPYEIHEGDEYQDQQMVGRQSDQPVPDHPQSDQPLFDLPQSNQPKTVAQEDWAAYIPFLNNFKNMDQIRMGVFFYLTDEFRTNLRVIQQRQNVLLNYVNCACPNTKECKKVPESDDDDLRTLSWVFTKPQEGEVVRAEHFYGVMSAFNLAVQKLTLRQNTLYEYVVCSCTAKTECSKTIEPILNVMFSNNANVSQELVQNLFFPQKQTSGGFISSLINLFTHKPSLASFIHGVSFNPLSTLFNIFKPVTTLPSDLWNTIQALKPSFSAGASYNSGSGSSHIVSISTGQIKPSSKPTSTPTSKPVSSNEASVSTSISENKNEHKEGDKVEHKEESKPATALRSPPIFFSGVPGAPYFPGQPGINAAGIGISAGQIGVPASQAGLFARPIGYGAGHVGINAGQVGVAAGQAGLAAGLLGVAAGQPGIAAGQIGMAAGQLGVAAGQIGITAGQFGLGGKQLDTPEQTRLVTDQVGTKAGQIGVSAGSRGMTTGVVVDQTGLDVKQVGLAAGQIGLAAGQVGVAAGQLGMAAGQVGLAANPVGMAPGQLGIAASQVGIAAGQAGFPFSKASAHSEDANIKQSSD